MKKRILILILLIISSFCIYCEEEETQTEEPAVELTEEQQKLFDDYGDHLDRFNELEDEELDVFVQYGDREQKYTAENILRYRAERDRLNDMKDALQKQLDDIPSGLPESFSLTNQIQEDIDIILEELNNLDIQQEIDIGDAKAISEIRKAAKEAQKKGDPVKITRGSYEQNDTDFTFGSVQVFQINRNYDSESVIYSSFGYGWSTNLDERIILGIEPDAAEIYWKSCELLTSLEEKITEQKQGILSTYEVTSVESGADEINQKFDEVISGFVNLRNQAHDYSFHDYVSYAESMITSLGEQRETLLRKFNQDVRVLAELKEQYRTEKSNNAIKKGVMEKSDSRKTDNLKAMFEGMDSSYEDTGLDTITIIDEGGYPHILTEKQNNVWKNETDRSISECRKLSDGKYEVVMPDGTVKQYDNAGFIIKITDRNSNWIFIKRTENEKIEYVKSSFGENLIFSYEGKYIKSIINGRDKLEKTEYTYNNGKLKTVKDTDGDLVTMEYNSDGQLEKLVKSDGSFIQFVYGEQVQDGRKIITSTLNEEGFAEHFNYYSDNTVYTDHDGNVTITWFYPDQKTKKEIRPDGSSISYEYNSDGTVKMQNENGSITRYYYENGNLTRTEYSDNSFDKTEYDSFNLVKMFTDRDGVTTEYIRDDAGNITSCLVGGVEVYNQKVNLMGQVVNRTVHGQKNVTTTYKYDDYGNLEYEICGGVKTEYEYDNRNRVTKVMCNDMAVYEYEYRGYSVIRRDYNGLETTYITNGRKDLTDLVQKDTVTGVIHKSRIEYDRRHLPLMVFEGYGENETLVSSYLYTPEGKIKAEIKYGPECWVTLYEYEYGEVHIVKRYKTDCAVPETVEWPEEITDDVYTQTYHRDILDKNGILLTVTDGLGYDTLFEYDSNGNLKTITDAELTVRAKLYSAAGKLKHEQASHGGWYEYKYDPVTGVMTGAGEKDGEFTQSEYYPDGSLKFTKDRYKKTTWYDYDSRGRVTGVLGEVQKTWYEYDSFDRIIKQIVGNTSSEQDAVYYVTYNYSEDGRTVTIIEGGKYKTTNEMDAFGNVIRQTDGNGNIRHYEYDCRNQLVKAYDGYNNITSYEYNALGKLSRVVQPDGAETRYYYNCMGLIKKITDECGTVYTASYDKAGRIVKEHTRADSEKTYEYDKTGRITAVMCGGEVVESYDYGTDSLVVTVTDGNGNEYFYNYDAYGRLVKERNRIILEQNYFYDSDGQLETQTNFDGSNTTIIYSSDKTVRTVRYTNGSENRFVYDVIGNIIETENAFGKTVYKYDQGGRLIYQKDVTTGEEILFTYDSVGNRTKLLSSNRETSYTYGKNNEVIEFFDNKQRIRVQLEYDKNGRELLRKFGNGTSEATLYDKAGRVTVKMQKSDRGELLWAEGYLYGDDGKRTATVDNKGAVTLYEYNKKGQLATVYYPYTQGMINLLKEEAEENGLPTNAELGENKYLPANIKDKLVPLMNSMQYGLAYQISNLQIFIKESYTYDKNGNRAAKTTIYGTIKYDYDKENRLLSSGSRGQTYINYTYDDMGNLLTEESELKTTKYAYNAQNRLIYCEVIDKSKKEYAQTAYAYDALGRRVIVQDKGETALRTIYDGLTFDVIKQNPTFENGLFTDSQNTGIRWSNNGKPTGDRYRYIGDADRQDNNRYIYLDENTYKTTTSRYYGERTQISVNGTLAVQSTNEGTLYFTTDLFGSVSSVTDNYGYQLGSYTYDAFGTLVQGDLSGTTDFGYLGKQNDSTSKLYNYGYRDYKPQSARFTTVDPIRDGTNWFAYVNNDPVNHFDILGLCEGSDKPRYKQKSTDDNQDFGPDLNFFPEDQYIFYGVNRTDDTSEDYIVAGHGNPAYMKNANDERMSPKELAAIIKNDPNYEAGMTVWLYSCETGDVSQVPEGYTVFAQRLANELGEGAVVMAPSTYVNVFNTGEIIVSEDIPKYVNGEIKVEKPGEWITFYGK